MLATEALHGPTDHGVKEQLPKGTHNFSQNELEETFHNDGA